MKVWIYLVMITGLMVFFHFAGLPSAASPFFDLLGINFGTDGVITSIETSASGFSNYFFGANGILQTLGLATAVIVVGFLTRSQGENMALLPFISVVGVMYVQTLAGLISYAVSLGSLLVGSIIVMIFLPLTVGFIMALAEWFRGTD